MREERGIATTGDDAEAIVNSLRRRLLPHAKELAHAVGDREQVARSRFSEEERAW